METPDNDRILKRITNKLKNHEKEINQLYSIAGEVQRIDQELLAQNQRLSLLELKTNHLDLRIDHIQTK